jgi:hypothetical protein
MKQIKTFCDGCGKETKDQFRASLGVRALSDEEKQPLDWFHEERYDICERCYNVISAVVKKEE